MRRRRNSSRRGSDSELSGSLSHLYSSLLPDGFFSLQTDRPGFGRIQVRKTTRHARSISRFFASLLIRSAVKSRINESDDASRRSNSRRSSRFSPKQLSS